MLKISKISKSFSGISALENVSLEFGAGEIHAICGENGAGKSTLMNIISGNIAPDPGEIFWEKTQISVPTAQATQKLSISIVYQERSLVDSLSVAENIFPINKPKISYGTIDFTKLYEEAGRLLKTLSLESISTKSPVGKLSSTEKQMVEIAKALAVNPKLLILDEPTASIAHTETQTLFKILRQLKEKGVAVIYISHRMAEIKEIADVVYVLKDGRLQGTADPKTTSTGEIVKMMVGRELLSAAYSSNAGSEVNLEVRDISGKGFRNVKFKLLKGEK